MCLADGQQGGSNIPVKGASGKKLPYLLPFHFDLMSFHIWSKSYISEKYHLPADDNAILYCSNCFELGSGILRGELGRVDTVKHPSAKLTVI